MKRLIACLFLFGCMLAAGIDRALAMTMSPGSHPAMYHRTSYRGAPDLQLALAVVVAGGGAKQFDAGRLVGVLAGPMTKAEVAKLTRQYGDERVASFLATFTYAIDDVLRLANERKIEFPPYQVPERYDGGALTAALVAAGTMPGGRFDIGYMIEHMISHDLHVALMHDINADPRFGPAANANFHAVLTSALLDLKSAYGL